MNHIVIAIEWPPEVQIHPIVLPAIWDLDVFPTLKPNIVDSGIKNLAIQFCRLSQILNTSPKSISSHYTNGQLGDQ